MARDVFISHSAQDKKIAETICGALEESSIRCWVAPRDVRPGRSFPGEITRAIQQSKVMLLIFSRHSNSSEQVLREVQLAVDCHVPIVRLRIEDITLSDDLRYYLSTPQYLDALTTPLSKHIPRVEAAIRELLEQAVDDNAGSTPQLPARAADLSASTSAATTQTKSSRSRVPFVIAGAAVVIAAFAFGIWIRTAKRPDSRSTLPPAPEPTAAIASPAVTATPIPTPPPSPNPTMPIAAIPLPSPTERMQSPEPNRKQPVPRNNRAWQQWIDEFVHNFIASNEQNDLDLAVSFYAPTVDLFEEGKKPADAIRRDVESYNARWPSRRATIRGDVRVGEKTANHNYTASFEHDYYVENASRGEWINGAVAVDLQITVDGGGVPRIVSMKQKTLRKDKGTMQRR